MRWRFYAIVLSIFYRKVLQLTLLIISKINTVNMGLAELSCTNLLTTVHNHCYMCWFAIVVNDTSLFDVFLCGRTERLLINSAICITFIGYHLNGLVLLVLCLLLLDYHFCCCHCINGRLVEVGNIYCANLVVWGKVFTPAIGFNLW